MEQVEGSSGWSGSPAARVEQVEDSPRWRGPPAARVEQVEDCRDGPRLRLELEGPT